MVLRIFFSAKLILTHHILVRTLLHREQFEEYGRDNHVGSKAWHEKSIVRVEHLPFV